LRTNDFFVYWNEAAFCRFFYLKKGKRMSEKVYLTEEGAKKLEREMYELRHNVRPEISQRMQEARELGDLKENAEYHASREELRICDAKIAQLQETLAATEIIRKEEIDTSSIRILSSVKLKNLKLNKVIKYTLVSQEEADLKSGKISINSPVGKGLLGHKVGETVEIKVPSGILKFEILEISA
jgi:transcription elongation factor GreA